MGGGGGNNTLLSRHALPDSCMYLFVSWNTSKHDVEIAINISRNVISLIIINGFLKKNFSFTYEYFNEK